MLVPETCHGDHRRATRLLNGEVFMVPAARPSPSTALLVSGHQATNTHPARAVCQRLAAPRETTHRLLRNYIFKPVWEVFSLCIQEALVKLPHQRAAIPRRAAAQFPVPWLKRSPTSRCQKYHNRQTRRGWGRWDRGACRGEVREGANCCLQLPGGARGSQTPLRVRKGREGAVSRRSKGNSD